mmetsp:Transcript_38589/g.119262  ORF Transcript_38589/g.119262 Transcript_38589/m.119262 type:complete len:208 (-) Transcript_38589:32-655(-)
MTGLLSSSSLRARSTRPWTIVLAPSVVMNSSWRSTKEAMHSLNIIGCGTVPRTAKSTGSWNTFSARTAASLGVPSTRNSGRRSRRVSYACLRHTLAHDCRASWLCCVCSERIELSSSHAVTSMRTSATGRFAWSSVTGFLRTGARERIMRSYTSGITSSCTVWPCPMPRMRYAPCEKSRKVMSLPRVWIAMALGVCSMSMPVVCTWS